MKILIVTAKLASPLVTKVTAQSEHEVHVLTFNTPIAAFLTPRRIVAELGNISGIELESLDMIITPGLIRKDVSYVGEVTGIPTYKGSTDAADLGVVLEMLDKIDLSSKKPADKLIEDGVDPTFQVRITFKNGEVLYFPKKGYEEINRRWKNPFR